MKQPLVSVIIPVYNTEPYVRQAVESIRQQTLRDVEIILINDGSTDGSPEILRELAQTDSRINVYEQENCGLSVTRNVGMRHATGQYIYFMDSDDLLEQDALEVCLTLCETQNLDFVLFDADILNEDGAESLHLKYDRSSCLKEKKCYSPIEALQLQLHHFCYTCSVCLIFIRATYLRKTGLEFFPGIIHEDQLFNPLLFLQAQRMMYLHRAFFHRRMRSGSIMTNRFSWRNMEGYLTVTEELIRFSEGKNQKISATIHLLLQQMLDAVMWQAHALPLLQRIKLLFLCLTRYRAYVQGRTLIVLMLKKSLL
ncbi:MAG: glycosyltransferase [Bacteroides sp.]